MTMATGKKKNPVLNDPFKTLVSLDTLGLEHYVKRTLCL